LDWIMDLRPNGVLGFQAPKEDWREWWVPRIGFLLGGLGESCARLLGNSKMREYLEGRADSFLGSSRCPDREKLPKNEDTL